ncbi:MAG TPA: hypothetical protein VGR35_23065 [Tepidisphaeraceae bacterium]|nr:hypothetical protein [Tepidisphaeraceae bacterium]
MIVPRKLSEKIQWCEGHVAPFNSNAVAIGTTVPEAAAFQTKTEAFRAALTAANEARIAAKDASLALKNAVAAVDIAAQGIIKQVRAKAETTNDPNVYTLASIPAPATPSVIGAPGLPTGMKVTLNPDGSLKLGWDCVNPVGSQGVIYHVYRQLGAVGEFTFVGGSGKKEFTDASVPSGIATIVYKVQGVRTTAIGVAAEFIVRFGTTASGAMTATVTQASPKLAA